MINLFYIFPIIFKIIFVSTVNCVTTTFSTRKSCDVWSNNIRKQLLKEKDLILLSKFASVPSCHSNIAKNWLVKHQDDEVNFVSCRKDKHHSSRIIDCHNWGKNHEARCSSCTVFGKRCNHCGKEDHFRSKCIILKDGKLHQAIQKPNLQRYQQSKSRWDNCKYRVPEIDCDDLKLL